MSSNSTEMESLASKAIELMNNSESNEAIAVTELIDEFIGNDENLTSPQNLIKYWQSLTDEKKDVFEKSFEMITGSSLEDYIKAFLKVAKE